jgi:flagellar hook-associated protein FlgK
MYALVQNNKIVKLFNNPQSFELNGNKYSSQIFTLWSNEEKNAIGIYEVTYNHSNKKDEGYYINTNEQFKFENNKVISYFGTATPKQLEDVNATDEDGEPILQDGVQVVIKGLKSQKISISKQQTAGLLANTDWYVTRKADTGTAIPQEIQDFRTEVRAISNQQETQINACTTVEQLKSLYEYTNTGTEQSPIYTRPLAEFPRTNRD